MQRQAGQNLPRDHIQGFADVQAVVLDIAKGLVGTDIALDAPLTAQGLDSLAAMELRQKLQVLSVGHDCV